MLTVASSVARYPCRMCFVTIPACTCAVVSGVDIQRHPKYNKGLAFSDAERDQLYLRGLLPPAVLSQELQVERVMINVRSQPNDLERYATHEDICALDLSS